MNYTYYFGLSGLNETSLIKKIYPEDLPSDWRISYYSNEFELLIIQYSDLLFSAQSDALSAEEILEQLNPRYCYLIVRTYRMPFSSNFIIVRLVVIISVVLLIQHRLIILYLSIRTYNWNGAVLLAMTVFREEKEIIRLYCVM